jgi:hypothetical protein
MFANPFIYPSPGLRRKAPGTDRLSAITADTIADQHGPELHFCRYQISCFLLRINILRELIWSNRERVSVLIGKILPGL